MHHLTALFGMNFFMNITMKVAENTKHMTLHYILYEVKSLNLLCASSCIDSIPAATIMMMLLATHSEQ